MASVLLLILQLALFAHPITSAYAGQVKRDVVVNITFADERPTKVCVSFHALDDASLMYPVDTHCWVPTSDIGSLDTWQGTRLDDGNWKVTVIYPRHPTDTIYLVMRVNT